MSSAIVALETPRDFSALHRLQSDEVWHFYSGTPLTMPLLYPDGHGETVTLGANVGAGQLPQVTVPGGVWRGPCRARTPPARTHSSGPRCLRDSNPPILKSVIATNCSEPIPHSQR